MNGKKPMFELAGRRALVTGSVRDLGFEIAKGLSAAGADVTINGRNAETLAQAAQLLAEQGYTVTTLTLDVADADAVEAWWEADAPETDILVNNVGLRDRRATPDLSAEDFARVLDVGITSAYRLTRLFAPGMIAKGGGAIINVASVAGPLARPGDPGYTAAKAGLDGLTRSHAMEYADAGIRVNAIAPGFFATEANDEWVDDAAVNDWLQMRVPMKRWGTASEVSGAVIFLASDAASYVTGHTLAIDGGLMARM